MLDPTYPITEKIPLDVTPAQQMFLLADVACGVQGDYAHKDIRLFAFHHSLGEENEDHRLTNTGPVVGGLTADYKVHQDFEDLTYLYIQALATHPDFQRRNIARRLLRIASERAWKKEEVKAVQLISTPSAELFYDSFGFYVQGNTVWWWLINPRLKTSERKELFERLELRLFEMSDDIYHMTFYGNPLHERHVGDYFPPEPVIDQRGVTGLDKIYRTEFKKRVPNLKKNL
ncbi:unnamed protein product, partial [Didymodactylos carnosus]